MVKKRNPIQPVPPGDVTDEQVEQAKNIPLAGLEYMDGMMKVFLLMATSFVDLALRTPDLTHRCMDVFVHGWRHVDRLANQKGMSFELNLADMFFKAVLSQFKADDMQDPKKSRVCLWVDRHTKALIAVKERLLCIPGDYTALVLDFLLDCRNHGTGHQTRIDRKDITAARRSQDTLQRANLFGKIISELLMVIWPEDKPFAPDQTFYLQPPVLQAMVHLLYYVTAWDMHYDSMQSLLKDKLQLARALIQEFHSVYPERVKAALEIHGIHHMWPAFAQAEAKNCYDRFYDLMLPWITAYSGPAWEESPANLIRLEPAEVPERGSGGGSVVNQSDPDFVPPAESPDSSEVSESEHDDIESEGEEDDEDEEEGGDTENDETEDDSNGDDDDDDDTPLAGPKSKRQKGPNGAKTGKNPKAGTKPAATKTKGDHTGKRKLGASKTVQAPPKQLPSVPKKTLASQQVRRDIFDNPPEGKKYLMDLTRWWFSQNHNTTLTVQSAKCLQYKATIAQLFPAQHTVRVATALVSDTAPEEATHFAQQFLDEKHHQKLVPATLLGKNGDKVMKELTYLVAKGFEEKLAAFQSNETSVFRKVRAFVRTLLGKDPVQEEGAPGRAPKAAAAAAPARRKA